MIGGRLYTGVWPSSPKSLPAPPDVAVWTAGPLFVKYNALLRAFTGVEWMKKTALEMTMGNGYTTTLHAINSCLVKLAKIMKAAKVYRGIAGGALPNEMLVPNEHNLRAAVDFAFLSTSLDRDVAVTYAGCGAATILEMQMGMVDRGADLSWLSQSVLALSFPLPASYITIPYRLPRCQVPPRGRDLLPSAAQRVETAKDHFLYLAACSTMGL